VDNGIQSIRINPKDWQVICKEFGVDVNKDNN